MKNFSTRLKELRAEKEITGEELGKKFNVSKTAVSYLMMKEFLARMKNTLVL